MRVDQPAASSPTPQAKASSPPVANALSTNSTLPARQAPSAPDRPTPSREPGVKADGAAPRQAYRAPAKTGQPTVTSEQVRHRQEIARQPSGANPKPTKQFAERPPERLSSAPPRSADAGGSGMERAMGALADRLHQPKRRR